VGEQQSKARREWSSGWAAPVRSGLVVGFGAKAKAKGELKRQGRKKDGVVASARRSSSPRLGFFPRPCFARSS
jgi:hypothetical protein